MKAIVIGASAGGLGALKQILTNLPENFDFAVIIVQHIGPSKNGLAELFKSTCKLPVIDAEDKMPIESGKVYFAPAGYHLLVEKSFMFSLSVDDLVNFSRPSIDVLFETAAEAFSENLMGVILTGANSDGAKGLRFILRHGGVVMVQDPETAVNSAMPEAAIMQTKTRNIFSLKTLPQAILSLSELIGKGR